MSADQAVRARPSRVCLPSALSDGTGAQIDRSVGRRRRRFEPTRSADCPLGNVHRDRVGAPNAVSPRCPLIASARSRPVIAVPTARYRRLDRASVAEEPGGCLLTRAVVRRHRTRAPNEHAGPADGAPERHVFGGWVRRSSRYGRGRSVVATVVVPSTRSGGASRCRRSRGRQRGGAPRLHGRVRATRVLPSATPAAAATGVEWPC